MRRMVCVFGHWCPPPHSYIIFTCYFYTMKYSRARAKFGAGAQREFLLSAKKHLGVSWIELAKRANLNPGTLKSYFNEYCTLPWHTAEKICICCGWSSETKLEKFEVKKTFRFGRGKICLSEQVFSGEVPTKLELGRMGMVKSKHISIPVCLDKHLAEEIGVHLGDGFLSDKKYDFRVKGDKNNERAYYDVYLASLYWNLFKIKIKNKDYGTSYGFEIYSKDIWLFKTRVLGISAGKKNAIRIPLLIRDADTGIQCAFLRGLMDTDGSFEFRSRYSHNGYYPVISLATVSAALAKDALSMFLKLGFSARLYKKSNGSDEIYLYGYANFQRYEAMIGWHNTKNIAKVAKFHHLWPGIASGPV